MSVRYTAIFYGCKNDNFQIVFLFLLQHRLWVNSEVVLISTHNLCFRAKIRENVYPCKPQLYDMSRDMRKRIFAYAKTKPQIRCAVTGSVYVHSTNSKSPPLKRTKTMPKFHLITEKYSKNTRLKILSKNAAAFSFRISKSSRENNVYTCT